MTIPTTLTLMKIAAQATWRRMLHNDFIAFSGAPAGSMICDQHPKVLIIHSPATGDEGERMEFHGSGEDGEPWCIMFAPERLI